MKKFVLNFCFITFFVGEIFAMANQVDIEAQKTKTETKKSEKEILAKWIKRHGASLVLTTGMTVSFSLFMGANNIVSDLAQNSLAECIADSLDFQWDENKSPLSPSNFFLWLGKMAGLYFSGITLGNLAYFYNMHLGLNFALAVATFHVTRKHFLDERDKKDEELQETLSKILSDPKFAQFRQQMAEKTIEVIVHNPEIVAQQIHDPVIAQNLKAISADPKLVEQFQQTFEAQLSMFMRPVLEQVTEPILPAPAPACLLDLEDDSGASSASAASTSASEANGKQAMLQASVPEEDPFRLQLRENVDLIYDLVRERYKKDLVQMTLAIKAQQEKEANQKAAMLAQKAQEKKAQEAKSSWWPWHKSNDKKTQSPATAALAANESGGLLMSSSAPIEIVIDAMIAQDNSKIPGVRKGLELSDPSTGFSRKASLRNSGNAKAMNVPMHDKTSSSSSDSSPLDNLKKPLLGGSDDEV